MIRMLVLVLTAAAWLIAGCGHEATVGEAEYATMQARVALVNSETGPQELEVYGSVRAGKEATLTGRATGPVVRILVGAGDTVRKGEVLLELEERMSAGQLAQAQGALSQAQAALSVAEKNYTRFQSLYEKKACSELELDMARMQHEQAKGAVEQAQGAVETASSVAGETGLRAPFDALIVQKMIDVGDLAAPGRPLLQIQSLTGREFAMQVRASDIDYLNVGDTIQVDLTRNDATIPAVITEIAGGADPATHSFSVKADLGDADVRAGLTGRALIKGKSSPKILIPVNAVYRTGGLALVSVVDTAGISRTRAVTVGNVRSGMLEVLSGLSGGERVVLDRTGPIAEGTRIEIESQ